MMRRAMSETKRLPVLSLVVICSLAVAPVSSANLREATRIRSLEAPPVEAPTAPRTLDPNALPWSDLPAVPHGPYAASLTAPQAAPPAESAASPAALPVAPSVDSSGFPPTGAIAEVVPPANTPATVPLSSLPIPYLLHQQRHLQGDHHRQEPTRPLPHHARTTNISQPMPISGLNAGVPFEPVPGPLTLSDSGLTEEVFYFDQGARLADLANRKPSQILSASVINYLPIAQSAKYFMAWLGLFRLTDFAVRWTGFLTISKGGTYTFLLASDDGSALHVEQRLLVNNDGSHSMKQVSSTRTMAVAPYPLRLEYFQKDNEFGMILEYSGPDTGNIKIVMPAQVLRKAPWVSTPGADASAPPSVLPATLANVKAQAQDSFYRAKGMLDAYKTTATNVEEHAARTHAALHCATYAKLAWQWSNAAVAAETWAEASKASKECRKALNVVIESANRANDKLGQSVAVADSATTACQLAEKATKEKAVTESSQRATVEKITNLANITQKAALKATFYWKKEEKAIPKDSKRTLQEAVTEAQSARAFLGTVKKSSAYAQEYSTKIMDTMKLMAPPNVFAAKQAALAKSAVTQASVAETNAVTLQATKDMEAVVLMAKATGSLPTEAPTVAPPPPKIIFIPPPSQVMRMGLPSVTGARELVPGAPRPAVKSGCTFMDSSNFDPLAVIDDGSCIRKPR